MDPWPEDEQRPAHGLGTRILVGVLLVCLLMLAAPLVFIPLVSALLRAVF